MRPCSTTDVNKLNYSINILNIQGKIGMNFVNNSNTFNNFPWNAVDVRIPLQVLVGSSDIIND